MKKLILILFVCFAMQLTANSAMMEETIQTTTVKSSESSDLTITLQLSHAVDTRFEAELMRRIYAAGCYEGLCGAKRVNDYTFVACYKRAFSDNARQAVIIAINLAEEWGVLAKVTYEG